MTAAQKAARVKFNKAIAIRKKTGVSLKEAFAQVYGKKVGAVKKKAAKKSAPKKKAAKKSAPKKKVARKKASTIKKVASKAKKYVKSLKDAFNEGYYGTPVKKVPTKKKKISEQAILNKIHKVKHDVDSLDEAQHKHMMSGYSKKTALNEIERNHKIIIDLENEILELKNKKRITKNIKDKNLIDWFIKLYSNQLKEHKEHITQLKKFL